MINSIWQKIDEYVEKDDPYDSYIPVNEEKKLYFIQEGKRGNIKIGTSINPENRLNDLQTGNSHKLRILWVCNLKDASVENILHKIFDFCRLEREWFKPNETLLRFILETIQHSFDGQWFDGNKYVF